MKAIAEATGGIYAPLGAQGEGLGTIYQQAIAPLTKHELESRRQKVYIERFQWPLGLSLLFLLASLGVGTRRTLRKVMVPSTKKPQPILSTVGLLFMGLLLGAMSSAEASVSQAEQAYKKGDFETAAQEYASAAKEDPAKSELQYNLGAAAYKKGDFTSAIKAFQESLSGEQKGDSQRLATQQNTYYNLGNSFYRAGEKSGKGDPQQTIQAWEQSLKAYDAALQLRPEDTDAKYNRELVQKKLDELKKQQPPQQNKQDQNKQDQNKSDQNKQDQSADQNQSPNKGQPSPGQQANQPSANGQPQNKPGEQPKPGDQSTANNPPNNASGQDQTKPGNTGQDQANANKGDQGTPDQPKSQQPLPPTEVKPPNTAQANAGNSSKSDQEKAATEAARAAGELTPEEARNLLDSMKSEERRFPTGPVTRTNRLSDDDKPQKDW